MLRAPGGYERRIRIRRSGLAHHNQEFHAMRTVYNPGCALMLYKPDLAESVLRFLRENGLAEARHDVCCRHEPELAAGTRVVNTCPGCNKRFSSLYEGVSTVSLWEMLAESATFPFPDYGGMKISVHDACPVRASPHVHRAIRRLLERMNLEVVETRLHGERSVCCGDSVYRADADSDASGAVASAHAAMRKRAQSMPCDDVCVYCVSCVKSMHIGGRKPRYILDLLFGEPTDPQVSDTAAWHGMLQGYIDSH